VVKPNIVIVGFDPGENSGCSLYIPDTCELAGVWRINIFAGHSRGATSDRMLQCALQLHKLSAKVQERLNEWKLEPTIRILAVEAQFFGGNVKVLDELVTRRSYCECVFLSTGLVNFVVRVSPSAWQRAWGISSSKTGTCGQQALQVARNLLTPDERSPRWARSLPRTMGEDEAASVLIASCITPVRSGLDKTIAGKLKSYKKPKSLFL